MKTRKGQSSIELLAIVAIGMGLVLASSVWGYSAYSSMESQWREKSAENLARSIAFSADSAWSGAAGTRISVAYEFPSGISEISFNSNTVNVMLDEGSGRYVDLNFKTNAPISGNIGTRSGVHNLVFESREGGVRIFEDG